MQKEHTAERNDRLARLAGLKKIGINPYPSRLVAERTQIQEVLVEHGKLADQKKPIAIAGRIRSKRVHGSLLFADIEDYSGSIQLYVKLDEIGSDMFRLFTEYLDIGDFILAEGICETTKRGEKSLLVRSIQILTKSLRPLPEKWHGLKDIEVRFRKRELDILSSPAIKKYFVIRSTFVTSLRNFLNRQGFIEVETPVLQGIPGGAAAEPFVTHHNSLNQDMYLRIAPELYLKRLIVGGFEKVYEIARCFRNEGVDTQHNPEFTQIELYAAYMDFVHMMSFAEKMLSTAIQETIGEVKIPFGTHILDFTPPYPKKRFSELFVEYFGEDISKIEKRSDIESIAKTHHVDLQKEWGRGKCIDELYKKIVRPKIIQPLFVTHHPKDLSPLAKSDSHNPSVVERFQLVVCGMEILNAFSELNDPLDQKKRFDEQEKLRKTGDREAQQKDDTYIESLEYGLPPTAGLGFGIDRFTNILTDTHNIKEAILFPTLRLKE